MDDFLAFGAYRDEEMRQTVRTRFENKKEREEGGKEGRGADWMLRWNKSRRRGVDAITMAVYSGAPVRKRG